MTTETTLNPRQLQFTRNYVATGNATKAYKDAGYSVNGAEVSASQLSTKPKVKAEIERLKADIEQSSTVDAAFVINGLRDIATNGNTESNRVRSYELLGKTLRMFVEVSENTVHHDVQPLQEFSLSQLRASNLQAALRGTEDEAEDAPIEVNSRELPAD